MFNNIPFSKKMTTTILLVDNTGIIKPSKVKEVNFDNLYKKCGFRSSNNFEKRTTWNVTLGNDVISVDLWAKNDGKANSENKYDFPPPVDKELYFGTCVLVRVDENNEIISLTPELWTKMYERLFGGFEDLGNESGEDDEISEEENIPSSMKTKHGYLKDGFVVDDNKKNKKSMKRGRKDSVSSASESDDNENYSDAGSGGDSSISQSSEDSYDSEDDEDYVPKKKEGGNNSEDDDEELDISGSELEEECYEYSDDE
jgi:hypothetical protein